MGKDQKGAQRCGDGRQARVLPFFLCLAALSFAWCSLELKQVPFRFAITALFDVYLEHTRVGASAFYKRATITKLSDFPPLCKHEHRTRMHEFGAPRMASIAIAHSFPAWNRRNNSLIN